MNPDARALAIYFDADADNLHRAVQLLAFDAGYRWRSQIFGEHRAGFARYDTGDAPILYLYRNPTGIWSNARFLHRERLSLTGVFSGEASDLVLSDLVTWLQVPSEP